MSSNQPRQTWSNRLTYILTVAGATVGFGATWRFPYLVGENGGGAYVFFFCIAMFVWGIRICGYTEKELGIQDYGGIVWDEIVAMILVLSFVPFRWSWWFAAFIVFRMFDMLKPWPIKWFDSRIHGGLGIMLDDLIAALMTGLVLGLASWIF